MDCPPARPVEFDDAGWRTAWVTNRFAIVHPSRMNGSVKSALTFTVLLVLAAAGGARAQSVPRVELGWGVDTLRAAWSEQAWHGDVADIFRLWRNYLTDSPGRQEPTHLWSAEEQRPYALYDHTAGIAYKGFPATVLDIRPATAGPSDEFVIRTLFAGVAADGGFARPVALTRVFATREDGRWVLGSALPRLTRSWDRTRVGSFTYVTHPTLPLDTTRARRAVAFADSLADALGVARPDDVTYVVADGPAELHRLMGVDWTFGGLGYGYAAHGTILSGDPASGEENRHEITHMVLVPILGEGRTHAIVNEGLATRLGGSSGRTFDELLTEYATFLEANPDVTLDTILDGSSPDMGWSPAGAVIVAMVLEHSGPAGLLELLRSGRSGDDLRAAVSRLLEMPWMDVPVEWRNRIVGRAGAVPQSRPGQSAGRVEVGRGIRLYSTISTSRKPPPR
jgi:hypothetical protein